MNTQGNSERGDAVERELVPVVELVRRMTGGTVISPSTAWRWSTAGVNGAVLRVQRVGKKTYSTVADWVEFCRQQAEYHSSGKAVAK